jgi:hypothetical protein
MLRSLFARCQWIFKAAGRDIWPGLDARVDKPMLEKSTKLPDLQPLVDLLRAAGQAHHQAYLAVDGEDPEWPSWYAGFLLEPMQALGLEMTSLAELSEALLNVQAAYAEQAPEIDWPTFYAQDLLQRFG